MEQDGKRHFLSLTRVLVAAILGGLAAFVLLASNPEDFLLFAADPEATARSKKFLESAEGFAFLVVMMAEFAIWGVFAVLIWTKTLRLITEAVRHQQRLQVIRSLAMYLAAYALLLWLPQPFFNELMSRELTQPLEQIVPLSYYQVRQNTFLALQFVVKLFPVAGIWLADWSIRNKVASNASEEEYVSALLEARGFLLNLGAVLATLTAFSFLSLVLWGEALRPYVHFSWFSRPPFVIYGLYLTVLVAIPYIPAYLNLLAAGRAVRDRFYPGLSPGASIRNYEDREIRRRRVDELLRLQLRAKEGLKILITILAPVATSVVYAFLGLKH
jgi:hypothetical protein